MWRSAVQICLGLHFDRGYEVNVSNAVQICLGLHFDRGYEVKVLKVSKPFTTYWGISSAG